MQINDCILAAIGPGQINDRLLLYYQANGATSDDINDAEREFLVAQGADIGNVNDMWFQFLRSIGYIGALTDMLYRFWCIGGGEVTPLAYVTHIGEQVTHFGTRVSHGVLQDGFPRDFSVEWITNPITEVNETNCQVEIHYDPIVNLNDRYHLYINGNDGQHKYRTGLCTAPSGDFIVGGIDCSDFATGTVSAYLNIEDTVTGEGRMFGPVNVAKISRFPSFVFDPDDYAPGTALSDTAEWELIDGPDCFDIRDVSGENAIGYTEPLDEIWVQLADDLAIPEDQIAIGVKLPVSGAISAGVFPLVIGFDNATSMGVRNNNNKWEFYERVGGAWVTRGSITTWTPIAGDVLFATFIGKQMQLYINGTYVGQSSVFTGNYDSARPGLRGLPGNVQVGPLSYSFAVWDLRIPPS